MKQLLLTGLVLLGGYISTSAQNRLLSLDEAISLGLQNSNNLKLSNERIAEATAALAEAKERRLPDASISGSYLRLNQPNVTLKTQLGGGGNGDGSGGEQQSSGSTIKVDQVAYAMANATLPLFSGFRIQSGIESSRYLLEATKLDASTEREKVVANIIGAYINLYKSKAALDLVQESLRESEQRVKDFSNLERNGVMARNDLLKAQLQQSNVELALVDAQNNWKLTNVTMDLLLGLPEETTLQPDSSFVMSMTSEQTFKDWEAQALANRKDLQALDKRESAAEAGVKAAKGEYYPSLAITGGYVAANIPSLLTVTNAINVGVGLSYSPSSLWKAGSKVAQAKSRVHQLEINRSMLSDGVRLEVAQAYQNYLSNIKKIEVHEKAVEQANENYRIVNNKYTNALATTTELLDADIARLQARLNYSFAKADAYNAYSKLLQTAGLLNETSLK